MALTLKGLQGTISDTDMATQLGGHHLATVRSPTDLAVTAVAGARTVNVAAGIADSAFLKVTNDGAAAGNLVLAPPASGGKWYAITLDRQWSPTNAATLRADDLAVTDTNGTTPTIPTAAALNAAAAMPNQPGTSGSTAGQRQVLALVYVRAADTTLAIFDLRVRRTGAGTVSFATLYGLLYALAANLLGDGAVASVGTHTLASGGRHIRSTWMRTGTGQYVTTNVGEIDLDEAGSSGGTARGDLRALIFLALANGINPGVQGVRDATSGYVWRWKSSASDWLLWEGGGTVLSAGGTVYGQNGVSGYDASFSTDLRRAGRLATLILSINTGASALNQGTAIVKLPAGLRGLTGIRQTFWLQIGFANAQGWGSVQIFNEFVYFYQWAGFGAGGPNGQVPANTPMIGTMTYVAEE